MHEWKFILQQRENYCHICLQRDCAQKSVFFLYNVMIVFKDDTAPMEVEGQTLSTCLEAVYTELAPTNGDQRSVNDQTNGEVCNGAVSKSTSGGQNSKSNMALVHSNSRSSLGNRHQKRKVHVPLSLMSPEDKQSKRKKERNRKKKMIRKLERRLESRSDLSYQQRKRIKGRLKRLRPHKRKKHKKKEATAKAANKEPSEQM